MDEVRFYIFVAGLSIALVITNIACWWQVRKLEKRVRTYEVGKAVKKKLKKEKEGKK